MGRVFFCAGFSFLIFVQWETNPLLCFGVLILGGDSQSYVACKEQAADFKSVELLCYTQRMKLCQENAANAVHRIQFAYRAKYDPLLDVRQ